MCLTIRLTTAAAAAAATAVAAVTLRGERWGCDEAGTFAGSYSWKAQCRQVSIVQPACEEA
jgi:hypothetical protein